MDNVAKDMLMGMMGPSWDGGNHRWDGKLGMKRAFSILFSVYYCL